MNSSYKADKYLVQLCYVWDELSLDEQVDEAIFVTKKAWPRMAKHTRVVIAGYILLAGLVLGGLLVATAHLSGSGGSAWVGWVFLAGAFFGALLMLLARK